ncbi:hypothetical protein MNVI_03590 [Mycobacterium noviomagense]|jgi:hypothetical protein|uniref:Uncharacterized protein n=1 Tax=Mycobacterium noviomagense TaxID=459858 RepID=A0A7I7P8Y3_9MYCO|nr:hypothetical protein MNVI_03590 [Mycobacterium noviomagense]
MSALIGRRHGWLTPVTQILRLPAWKILGGFVHGTAWGQSLHSPGRAVRVGAAGVRRYFDRPDSAATHRQRQRLGACVGDAFRGEYHCVAAIHGYLAVEHSDMLDHHIPSPFPAIDDEGNHRTSSSKELE